MPSTRRTLKTPFLSVASKQQRVKTTRTNVWLFTSVAADYDGAVLLKQFVHHYIDLGIKPENFLVVINSKSGFRTEEFDKCAKILNNFRYPVPRVVDAILERSDV